MSSIIKISNPRIFCVIIAFFQEICKQIEAQIDLLKYETIEQAAKYRKRTEGIDQGISEARELFFEAERAYNWCDQFSSDGDIIDLPSSIYLDGILEVCGDGLNVMKDSEISIGVHEINKECFTEIANRIESEISPDFETMRNEKGQPFVDRLIIAQSIMQKFHNFVVDYHLSAQDNPTLYRRSISVNNTQEQLSLPYIADIDSIDKGEGFIQLQNEILKMFEDKNEKNVYNLFQAIMNLDFKERNIESDKYSFVFGRIARSSSLFLDILKEYWQDHKRSEFSNHWSNEINERCNDLSINLLAIKERYDILDQEIRDKRLDLIDDLYREMDEKYSIL